MNKLSRIFDLIRITNNWALILSNRIFGTKLKGIELRSGVKFTVENKTERAELAILTDIWQKHIYDPSFLCIAQTDTVIDIGAHKGYFSVYAATKATQGKVYSFEPVPRLSKFVQANAVLNNLNNISINNLAVWSQSGWVNLHLSSNSGGSSMRPKPSTTGTIKVQAITLEEFCLKNSIKKINFLKLDCEGAEYDILLNLGAEMFEKISQIAMETHDFGSYHHSAIASLLKENNFKVTVTPGYLYASKKLLQSL